MAGLNLQPVPPPGALLDAVWHNDLIDARRFLQKGSDVNEMDSLGNSPLIHAARNGSPDMMRLLLGNGADIDSQNSFGYTALTYLVFSADGSREPLIRLLLDQGADMGIKNSDGNDAMDLAIQNSRPDIVNMLNETTLARKKLADDFARAAAEKIQAAEAQRRATVAAKQERLKELAKIKIKPGPKPPKAA
jgi:ankyrin repeat protein